METTATPRSQLSVAFKYAIITGLISSVYFLVLYLLKAETSKVGGWIGYLILIAIMYLGIKDYRDKDLGGYINFGKSFSTGILIAFFAGIIYAIFVLIFISFVDTNFINNILQISEQNMIDKGMSQEQIEMGMKYSKMFVSPIMLTVFTVIGYAFFGMIFSLILSAILKKENPQMPQA
jgi:hypothetical protein